MDKENVNPYPKSTGRVTRALSKMVPSLKPSLEKNSSELIDTDYNHNSYKKMKKLTTNEEEVVSIKMDVLPSNVIPLKMDKNKEENLTDDAMENSDDETVIDYDYQTDNAVEVVELSDSEEENIVKDEVENDPNFTVICAFLEHFGSKLKIRYSIPQLKALFEDYDKEGEPKHLFSYSNKFLFYPSFSQNRRYTPQASTYLAKGINRKVDPREEVERGVDRLLSGALRFCWSSRAWEC